MTLKRLKIFLSAALFGLAGHAVADEAAIRKNLAERLPNLPVIDEVSKTPMGDLWEVRMGSQILYSDGSGTFVIQGQIINTESRQNLTQVRIDGLTAFDFAQLPLADAVVWKQGSGARKLVVFADPNCGYCKRLERELNGVADITVYTFLIPILGGDSPQKSAAIWCAQDSGKAWRDWMIDGVAPPGLSAECDTSALQRNVQLGDKHAISGTPTLVFEDSTRVPGILSAEDLEKQLLAASAK